MKVLLLKEALPGGGAERQLALITEHLPERWERRVWTMGGGPFVAYLRERGLRVQVDARAARFDVRPALALWRLIWVWRPDVVHSWDWMSSLAALPLCRLLGIPIVDGAIRNGIARRRRSLPLRAAMRAARLVVANSRAGLDAWGVAAGKGRVVYNAFDPARRPLCSSPDAGGGGGAAAPEAPAEPDAQLPGAQSQASAHTGPVTVVMTGRMVAHKDFDTVIAVVRRLEAGDAGGWRLLLVGDGPERPRLEAAAADLVARDVVRFAAPGLEVLPLVRDADVGVLMSHERVHREGCSNAIMEYMACGLPVVCSSGGGNPELVVEGQTGYLVPAGDETALAERLQRLAADDCLSRRLGAAGRDRLESLFTVERLVCALERVYLEALS